MAQRVASRLQALNIDLPSVRTPAANYLPYSRTGLLVYIAGQICQAQGHPLCMGKVGGAVDLATAQRAARVCGLNILAVLAAACDGDLDRVVRCVRLGGFVNVTPGFTDIPMVVNGASDLMVEVFGDAGRHARTAVGVAELPRGAAVEVDAIFEVAP
ncbi:MAG: RidA family protein [Betaproteobacteria bacterium]|nr:MAG: RidA family protein [Betaproteobacteria bacterium]